MDTEENQNRHCDSCFSWIVCLCSFAAHFVLAFNMVCFGVLLPEFTTHFEQTQSVMGLLGASRVGLIYFSGSFAGGMTKMLGCRKVVMAGFIMATIGSLASAFANHLFQLVLMFGVVSGIGTGLCYIPLTVIVQRYFKKRRALSISIATTGLSLGSVILGSLSGVLIHRLTWRGFLMVLACCNIQVLLPAAFFFPVNQRKRFTNNEMTKDCSYLEQEHSEASDKDQPERSAAQKNSGKTFFSCIKTFILTVFDISLLKAKPFLVFTGSFFLVNMGFAGPYMIGPNRAVVQGVDKMYTGFLLTSVGSMSCCGRILAGIIADRACIGIIEQFSISVLIGACALFLSTLAGSQLSLHLLFSGLSGLALGGYEGIQAMCVVHNVGSQNLAKGMAWIQCMRGISNLVALPLSGWLFDISHGYLIPYIVLAVMQTSGGVAVFVTRFMNQSWSHTRIQQRKADESSFTKQAGPDGDYDCL